MATIFQVAICQDVEIKPLERRYQECKVMRCTDGTQNSWNKTKQNKKRTHTKLNTNKQKQNGAQYDMIVHKTVHKSSVHVVPNNHRVYMNTAVARMKVAATSINSIIITVTS